MKKHLYFILIILSLFSVQSCYKFDREYHVPKEFEGYWKIKTLTLNGQKLGTGPIVTYVNKDAGTLDLRFGGDFNSNTEFRLVYSALKNIKTPVSANPVNFTSAWFLSTIVDKTKGYKISGGIFYNNGKGDILILDENTIEISWSDFNTSNTGKMELSRISK